MSELPEYDWVQSSIDMTISEIVEARNLTERLKESGGIQKEFYYFPPCMIKNPVYTNYLELPTIGPEKEVYILTRLLSEN